MIFSWKSHFTDDILKLIFLYENLCILNVPLKVQWSWFIMRVQVTKSQVLVKAMALTPNIQQPITWTNDDWVHIITNVPPVFNEEQTVILVIVQQRVYKQFEKKDMYVNIHSKYTRRWEHLSSFLLYDFAAIVYSSSPGQNGLHITDNIFTCIFGNEKFCILIEISLKFIPKGPIDNNPALV